MSSIQHSTVHVHGSSSTTGRRIDNLVLLPAAHVATYATWQARANQLPPGTVLIVLPAELGRQREALAGAAHELLAKGRMVTVEELPASVAAPPSQQPDWPPAVVTAVQLALQYGASGDERACAHG